MPYMSLCTSGVEENASNSSVGVWSERRVLWPKEKQECLQEQIYRSSEHRVSSPSQPWVFQAQSETKFQKRHRKLGQSQNGSKRKTHVDRLTDWKVLYRNVRRRRFWLLGSGPGQWCNQHKWDIVGWQTCQECGLKGPGLFQVAMVFSQK